MADEYDFTGLTLAQQRVLTFQGWTAPRGSSAATMATIDPQPSREQMAPLVARGLVIEHRVTESRGGIPMTWWEYEVPIPVHMAWCMWGGDLYTKNGKPARPRSRR